MTFSLSAPVTDLTAIVSKVRKITARPSTNQITDTEIQDYVNYFYLYTLPESLRLLNLRDYFTFTTIPNIDTYNFDSNAYLSCDPIAYCSRYTMTYFQDPDAFYKQWPSITTRQQVATGDGINNTFTFTIPNVPFLRSTGPSPVTPITLTPLPTVKVQQNVLFEAPDGDTVLTAQDDGQGGFIAPAVGSIDYLNGTTTLTLNGVPAAGIPISAQTINYSASRPTSMLYYNEQFVMRPVPDTAYMVQVQAYRKPTVLLASQLNPELQEWWELLAYGAAMKIFADNADFEQMGAFRPYYEEQLILMQRRTLKQYQNQRASTIFSAGGAGAAYPNNYPNM